MKFKDTNHLLQMILEDKLIVEMKLKELSEELRIFDIGVKFFEGKEKWVECKFEDYASFSPISSKYKVNVVPLEKNFKGKDYYFSDLHSILNMEDEERTKIRVRLKEG